MGTRSLNIARSTARRSGFTLVEMAVVLVIAAVIAATAVPTLSSLGSTRALMAARQLQRDMTYARQRAVATGIRTWVVFNVSGQTWTIKSESSTTPGKASATTITDPGTGKSLVQALNTDPFNGVTISSASFDSAQEVGFDWLGKPLNSAENQLAANGIVTLTGGNAITVAIGTGNITRTP